MKWHWIEYVTAYSKETEYLDYQIVTIVLMIVNIKKKLFFSCVCTEQGLVC